MKNTPFIKFLRSISLYAILLIIVSAFLFGFIIPQYYLRIFPVLFLLFYSVNSAFSYLIEVSAEKRNMVVIRSFLLGWTIKFLIYVLFLIIYVLINRENAVNFLIQFTSLYVVFFGFRNYLSHQKF